MATDRSGQSDEDPLKADLACFFASGAQPYLQFYEKKRRQPAGGRRWPSPSWSWPAFGGWAVWFCYRKMRSIGLLVVLLPSFASLVAGDWAGLLVYLGTAVFAKEIYLKTALKAIATADHQGLAGEERRRFLRLAGGTSLPWGALGAVLVTVMSVLSALDSLPDIIEWLDAAGLLIPS